MSEQIDDFLDGVSKIDADDWCQLPRKCPKCKASRELVVDGETWVLLNKKCPECGWDMDRVEA